MNYTQQQMDDYVESIMDELSDCDIPKVKLDQIAENVRKDPTCPHFQKYVKERNEFHEIMIELFRRASQRPTPILETEEVE